MGIRERLQKQGGRLAGVLAGCAGLALAVSIYANRPSRATVNTKAYYSDDDGQTYFTDDLDKLYPFDHHGRQAYLANVFKCSKGGPFVAYLSRVNDAARPKLERMRDEPGGTRSADYQRTLDAAVEIRRPGDATWARPGTPAFFQIASFACPDGGTDPHSLHP